MAVTLIIKINDQYIPLFKEMAETIGAPMEIKADDQPDSEMAVLDRIERSYRQVDIADHGGIKLRPLNNFLRTIN